MAAVMTVLIHRPDGTIQAGNSLAEAGEALSGEHVRIWIDLESPEMQELIEVGEVFKLDAGSLETAVRGRQRPRIDEFADHMFLLLYGLLGADNGPNHRPRKLAAFCGNRFLVTVHPEALKTIRAVRERCRNHPAQVLGRGVDYVLYIIIGGVVDYYLLAVDQLEAEVERLEEVSLKPEVDESILRRVLALQRKLMQLRRLAASQREMLAPIARGEYDYIAENLDLQFSHIHDHLSETVEQIDSLREHLQGVHDNYHAAITSRINATMRTLTVFAALMMPLTLIAGIYGMNLKIWPSERHPGGFWAVLGLMALVAGVLLHWFRRKKWI